MSPLWSDIALARAAWAKAEDAASVDEGKANPVQNPTLKQASRPARRVHHSWLGSSFAL